MSDAKIESVKMLFEIMNNLGIGSEVFFPGSGFLFLFLFL